MKLLLAVAGPLLLIFINSFEDKISKNITLLLFFEEYFGIIRFNIFRPSNVFWTFVIYAEFAVPMHAVKILLILLCFFFK